MRQDTRNTGQETRDKGYRKLLVWKEAHALTLLVYKAVKGFPREEMFALTSQIRRAAFSVPANIVEGYARSSTKEFLQFLFISRGSLAEVEYYLELSKDLNYLSTETYELLEQKRGEVGRLLYGLILSVRKRI